MSSWYQIEEKKQGRDKSQALGYASILVYRNQKRILIRSRDLVRSCLDSGHGWSWRAPGECGRAKLQKNKRHYPGSMRIIDTCCFWWDKSGNAGIQPNLLIITEFLLHAIRLSAATAKVSLPTDEKQGLAHLFVRLRLRKDNEVHSSRDAIN